MQHFNATIIIGGTLPLELVPQFCECIIYDMCKLAPEATTDFKPTNAEIILGALTTIEAQKQLKLFVTDSISGGFTLTELFLLRHNMDFTLKSEGGFANMPFIVEARGPLNFYFTAPTNRNFEIIVTQKELKYLQNMQGVQEFNAFMAELNPEIPPLRPFHIITPQNNPDAIY